MFLEVCIDMYVLISMVLSGGGGGGGEGGGKGELLPLKLCQSTTTTCFNTYQIPPLFDKTHNLCNGCNMGSS